MDQSGFTKNKSAEVTETFLEIIKRTLSSGEDVLASGFGKFCVNEKAQSAKKGQESCYWGCNDAEAKEDRDVQMLRETKSEDQQIKLTA
jgi:hypothetical protein